ncbi:MAG: helix-turn-helix domain-containing protein [Desulfovibrio sp.]|jgi:hypothetical protein|nr:helix-turn-helix domain-containing protein [Desulfovibrio sp.]
MDEKLNDFSAQLARLKEAAGVKTDTALAHLLGITQGGFSGAKRRGNIPNKWFVAIATRYNVNLEWLLSGTGSSRKETDECALTARIADLEMRNRLLETENTLLKEVIASQKEALRAYRLALNPL